MGHKVSGAEPAGQSKPPIPRRPHAWLLACACLACSPAPDPAPPAGAPAADPVPTDATDPAGVDRVLLGVEVLLRDSLHLLSDRRVGLITNHTGVSPAPQGAAPAAADSLISTIDRLNDEPAVRLMALFSPEHGIRGAAEAGEHVASDRDPRTGLPIHSLYGETRRPTPEMLRDLDVLVFDIQDIGTRYYTYVWTMALAMDAAGEAGIPFIVLDRPNPIGGRLVQGNVLDPDYATFVGLYPVAMRHGLTAGELARLVVGEFDVDVELRVAPMDGWRRSQWHDQTGLPWLAPSPNMPTLESATHYPGTCLFEGTNLSVGRGTSAAFQQIGAPWMDAEAIAAALNAAVERGELAGVRFEPVSFVPRTPGDRKFGDETVRGVRFITTDRALYDPTRAGVALLVEVQRRHADRLEWRVAHFDRLAGTDRLRLEVQAGADLDRATAGWAEEAAAFDALRQPYLLYRD